MKTKILLRNTSNSVLDNIVSLHSRAHPQLRYIQNLWALNIIDNEDRFYEEPYDTLRRILPKVVDLINNTCFEKVGITGKLYRSNILKGLEDLKLAKRTEDYKLELIKDSYGNTAF